MQNAFKYALLAVSLILFLSIRVGHMHAWIHADVEDHVEHCELCHLILASEQNTPLNFSPSDYTFTAEDIISYPYAIPLETYQQPLQSIVTPDYVYNKPPPHI